MRILLILPMLPAICLGIAASQPPAQPFKAGKLPAAEVALLQPGLTLRLYAKPDDAQALDARRVRLAALHVPVGTPPSPFVPAGPVYARLSGYLKNPLKGDYRFRLNGTGTMSLRVNGKEILKEVGKEAEIELAKNYNLVEIAYAGPKDGAATVRLEWAGEKFGFEPVPPDSLFSRKDDAGLVKQTMLREGRQLFAERHCANCHGLPGKVGSVDGQMPEVQAKGPLLDEVGNRFKHDWLVAWILDPRALRPEATMPSVLAGADAGKQAADIAAYLGALKGPTAEAAKLAKGGGEAAFKRYGCNACHRLANPKDADELGRLSLYHIAAKMPPAALTQFLLEPHKRYPWSRMPDFHLSASEAEGIAKFLCDNAKGSVEAQPMGDARRGEKLFQEVGCAHCHQVDPNRLFALPKIAGPGSLDKGCLADKPAGKAPNFGFRPEQRAALAAFLRTDLSSLHRETPAEFSLRQVKSLRCDSCHRRDGELTRWHVVLEDEGKLPENLPSLTWTGEKLKPAWTKKLFAGQADHSARPWIKAKMPAFPARAEMLAIGLSHEHGFGVDEDNRPRPDAKLAEIGEKLIPQQGGFNCVNCHGIGKKPAIQPFEAPGINLKDAAIRLRYDYYQRWMLAPDRVDVAMRMPVFATDGKTTQIRDVFDGDARKQFDALWHYIQTLPGKD